MYYQIVSTSARTNIISRHKLCHSLEIAKQQAIREAADTGGVVLHVKSLRVERGAVVATGLIPAKALCFENADGPATHLRPRSIGNLHLTRSSLLYPNTSDDIGYLVLQTPVVAGDLLQARDDDSCWGALTIERPHRTLRSGCIGAVCCLRCSRPISPQRLKAVPMTKVCIACQQDKETKNDRSN